MCPVPFLIDNYFLLFSADGTPPGLIKKLLLGEDWQGGGRERKGEEGGRERKEEEGGRVLRA